MDFKFISVKNILARAERSLRRFPIAVVVAFVGTVIGIVLVHVEELGFYPNILMTLGMGFPLFVSIVLIGEKSGWPFRKKIIANSVAIIFLIAYFFWLPERIYEAQSSIIIRYLMWMTAFILLITFAPFLKRNEDRVINSFWHYNKIIFFSFVLTAIWALAIQAGLSIAMASIDYLFNINIVSERYLELWIIIIGIFSTTFFLSRTPEKAGSLGDVSTYPKELRLFSQYVLVPLVALYFLILYAYVARIIIIWEWPKGILAYMILGFSLLGVATYVSLYVLRDKVLWIRRSGNIFYIALIPQVGMLFWALWFRLSQHGFTENRYFVFIFGWWLLFMAVYFIFNKKKDIRIIPATIFIIAFLSSFGPWGAFSVSEKSQINRLEKILIKNKLLIDNAIRKTSAEIVFDDRKEISALIRYLNDTHGLDGIQSWFDVDLSKLVNNTTGADDRRYVSDSLPEKVVEEVIGVEYVEQWVSLNDEGEFFSFYTNDEEQEKLLDISNYDYALEFTGDSENNAEINKNHYVFKVDNDSESFVILKNDNMVGKVDLHGFLDGLYKLEKQKQSELNGDEMKLDFKNENIYCSLYFSHVSGEKNDNKYIITSMGSKMFFTLIKP